MKRARTLSRIILAAAALSFMALPPAVQAEEPIRPPKVEKPAKPPKWLYFLVGAGAIAVCVGLAVFPGRRSHDD